MAFKHLSLKLLINKQTNRVIYAESGKDFVDILFGFLTMPVSSIVRLTDSYSKIGSLNTLYESVKDLDIHHLQTKACKNMLLHPRSASGEQFKNLALDIDEDTDPTEYYICPNWFCAARINCLVSTVENARCSCGEVMHRRVYRMKEDDGTVDGRDGVFVKGGVEFMITDGLKVFPVSTSKSLKLIKKLGVNEVTALEHRNVNVGRREVLHLLNRMLVSKTPLTDVFMGEKDIIGANLDIKVRNLNLKDMAADFKDMAQPQTEKDIETDSKNISLKLVISKSNNRVLYAEGGKEFPNLLFSFLTFPLGSIVKCLGGDTSMRCLDNLYKSVESLSSNGCIKSEECQEMLLDPKLATYFGCQREMLQIKEQVPYQPALFSCARCKSCGPYIKDSDNWTCSHGEVEIQLKTLNPKYPNVVMEPGGAFMAGPAMFMVTDELIVKPLSPISAVSLFDRLNINIDDLEEQFVIVGKEEALSMLKASLISKTVFNDVFSYQNPTAEVYI